LTKSILLTGAAGFIGSHTAVRLLRRGDRVLGLDNLNDYYSPEAKRRNLREIAREIAQVGGQSNAFEFIEGDIRDRALLASVFRGRSFDAVVNLAAMAGVRASVEDPWLYYDVNLTGTLNLLEEVRRSPKPANFVLASTSSAYGRSNTSPFVESAAADLPLAPYPASKRAAEMLGFSYHHLHGLDFTALRFFTVYGPRGRPDMMAYKVLESVFKGRELPLYNGGNMHRDWTYVEDIADGVLAAADRRLGYEIINLGRGEPVLVADFVANLERVAQRRAKLIDQPMNSADVAFTYADITKARALLGYTPQVSVSDGIERFYAWYMQTVHGS
jgi:UDP-glucuronate 4-epimerase